MKHSSLVDRFLAKFLPLTLASLIGAQVANNSWSALLLLAALAALCIYQTLREEK